LGVYFAYMGRWAHGSKKLLGGLTLILVEDVNDVIAGFKFGDDRA